MSSTNRNRQLWVLLLLVLAVVGAMLYVILGDGGGGRACAPNENISRTKCTCEPPLSVAGDLCVVRNSQGGGAGTTSQCASNSDCKAGEECKGGDCLPIVAGLPTCAAGEQVGEPAKCECKPPNAKKEGVCVSDLNAACQNPTLVTNCKRVEVACRGKDASCFGKAWSDMYVEGTDFQAMLEGFSPLAMLFPTGRPSLHEETLTAEQREEEKAAEERYLNLLKAHKAKLDSALMVFVLGRASTSCNKKDDPLVCQSKNEDYARTRMELAKKLWFKLCEMDHSQVECTTRMRDRFKIGALRTSRDSQVASSQFSRLFVSDSGKSWVGGNSSLEQQVELELAHQPNTQGANYMNQAIYMIPIPCDCAAIVRNANASGGSGAPP